MLSAYRFLPTVSKVGISTLRGFASRSDNPLVFMDFSVKGKDMGRIIFEVIES